jgi:hypothetical protein
LFLSIQGHDRIAQKPMHIDAFDVRFVDALYQRNIVEIVDNQVFIKGELLQNIIQNSSIVVTIPLTITTHLKVKTENEGKDVTTGILFINDTSNTPAKPAQVNSLYLFYYVPSNTWTLRYKYQGESKYYTLYTNIDELKEGNFTLAIAKDGKTVKVTYENGQRTISLPTSLYAITNRMLMNIQVASDSTLEVSSLMYQ